MTAMQKMSLVSIIYLTWIVEFTSKSPGYKRLRARTGDSGDPRLEADRSGISKLFGTILLI